jgi:glycosyltransferase 2 family protein
MDSKKVFKYSIGVVLSLAFLYFAFKGINFNELMNTLAGANYYWLFLFFIMQILSHFIRAWRWKYLLSHIKPDISMKNLFSSVMIGYMVNNFIPRGGEIARPYSLGKLENISVSSSLATVIVERVLDVLTLLVLVIFILIYNYELLITNFPWLKIAVIISIIISLCGIGFLVVLSLKTEFAFKIINKCTSFLPNKISGKIESLLRAFIEGLLVIKNPKNYFFILIGTVLLWVVYSLQWYVPFYSFNMVHDYSLTVVSSLMLNVIVGIGIMIPVPGATGTYHAFCIQSLTGLFHVNGATAAAYATVTHAVGMIGITIVGLYFFIKDNMKLSSITKKEN